MAAGAASTTGVASPLATAPLWAAVLLSALTTLSAAVPGSPLTAFFAQPETEKNHR